VRKTHFSSSGGEADPAAPPEEDCCFSCARRALRIYACAVSGAVRRGSGRGIYFFEIGVGHFERVVESMEALLGFAIIRGLIQWCGWESRRESLVCLDATRSCQLSGCGMVLGYYLRVSARNEIASKMVFLHCLCRNRN
jgi:hypothetical protein